MNGRHPTSVLDLVTRLVVGLGSFAITAALAVACIGNDGTPARVSPPSQSDEGRPCSPSQGPDAGATWCPPSGPVASPPPVHGLSYGSREVADCAASSAAPEPSPEELAQLGVAGRACQRNADCNEKPGGRCVAFGYQDGPLAWTRCFYDGCGTDAECGDGRVCACRAAGSDPVNACVPASCRVDADCPGGKCAAVGQGFPIDESNLLSTCGTRVLRYTCAALGPDGFWHDGSGLDLFEPSYPNCRP